MNVYFCVLPIFFFYFLLRRHLDKERDGGDRPVGARDDAPLLFALLGLQPRKLHVVLGTGLEDGALAGQKRSVRFAQRRQLFLVLPNPPHQPLHLVVQNVGASRRAPFARGLAPFPNKFSREGHDVFLHRKVPGDKVGRAAFYPHSPRLGGQGHEALLQRVDLDDVPVHVPRQLFVSVKDARVVLFEPTALCPDLLQFRLDLPVFIDAILHALGHGGGRVVDELDDFLCSAGHVHQAPIVPGIAAQAARVHVGFSKPRHDAFGVVHVPALQPIQVVRIGHGLAANHARIRSCHF